MFGHTPDVQTASVWLLAEAAPLALHSSPLIPALKGLKQLASVGERPFSAWGMALPLLRAHTLHNRALVPEGSLQGVLQLK